LACIYDLSKEGGAVKTSAIASRLHVAPASVTEMLQKLAADGYLDYEKYKGAVLTREGRRLAERIKRKHRLLERFLVDVLGMRKERSHEEACRLEHTVSDESAERLCQMMNNPQICPDGDPIPQCKDKCRECEGAPSIPLPELKEGDRGIITHLKCENPDRIRRLISMGFVPGRWVTLEEQVPMGGPLLIAMEDTRIALGKDYARLVQVRRCG